MPNWNDVILEITQFQNNQLQGAQLAPALFTRKYLQELFQLTGRNVIAYYSGFLSKPGISSLLINDDDKNGFMMAINQLDRSKGLDLFLHTPGGDVAATESIVYYLRKMFGGDIRAIVPQNAMSAGTMLACSCKEILMAKHSNLGPIDPQLNGIPAHGVIAELKRAYKEITENPSKAVVWGQIISKYHPTFIGQCENAIAWSEAFVKEQLKTVMFNGDEDAENKASAITAKLSNLDDNKTHARHIHIDECKEMGLKVIEIEEDPRLQDLILTIHHTYMHRLSNTPMFKVIENHTGAAYTKQQVTDTKLK